MYQNKIHSFICDNLVNINNAHFLFGDVIIFGINPDTKEYSGLIKQEALYIYHFKGQRVYKKIRELELLNGIFLDFVMSLKENTVLNYEDFDDSFVDCYTDKPITKLDFDTSLLIPIIKGDICNGVIILYFRGLVNNNFLNSTYTTRLFNGLIKDETEQIKESLNMVYGNNDFPTLIIKDKRAYLSKTFVDLFNLNRYSLKEDDEIVTNFISSVTTKKGKVSYNAEELSVYYAENVNNRIILNELYSPLMLKYLDYEEFSLIFVEVNEFMDSEDLLKKLGLNKSMVYAMANLYVIALSYIVNSDDLNKKLNKFKFSLIIDSNTVNSKMDLYNVYRYIYLEKPLKFVFNDYKDYLRNTRLEQISDYKLNKITKHIVYEDHQIICYNDHSTVSPTIFDSLKNYILKATSPLFVNLSTDQLLKRKFREVLEQFKEKKTTLYVILSKGTSANIDQMKYLIEYNVPFFIDSSLFFDFKNYEFLKKARGVYFDRESYQSFKDDESGLFSTLVNSFLTQKKIIIVDSEKDALIESLHAGYVIERSLNGKSTS